jgi:hypothetical protein
MNNSVEKIRAGHDAFYADPKRRKLNKNVISWQV